MPCAAGSYREETSLSTDETRATCSPCEAGKYQPDEAKPTCLPCTAGHFCTESSTAPIPCGSVALYCPIQSSIVNAALSGYYTTPTSAAEGQRVDQIPCEAGFACVGGVREECVEGSTYQPNPSQTSCLTCSTCPTGTYMINSCTSTSDTECGDCLAGTASMGGTATECTACTAYGEYSDKNLAR